MAQKFKPLLLVSLLLAAAYTSVHAAEREDVRKVVNLLTSVKMPYPEGLARTGRRRNAFGSIVMVRQPDASNSKSAVGVMNTFPCRGPGRKCFASAMNLRPAYLLGPCTTTCVDLISTDWLMSDQRRGSRRSTGSLIHQSQTSSILPSQHETRRAGSSRTIRNVR